MADEQLIDQVADKIEDVAVGVEEVADATRRLTGEKVSYFVVGAAIGVTVGFAIGFKIADKRLKTKYEKMAEDEISQMRDHYIRKTKAAETKPPIDEVIKERHEDRYTKEEQEAIEEVAEEEERVVSPGVSEVNVFEAQGEWNYKYETSQRTPGVPYIIHIDEFRENILNHDQLTYTYYEVDDVLADSRDTTIEDMDEAIGLGNLGRWGHGSPDDPNIVYIRNEEKGIDVELVRDRGSWSDTVHGSIRHSMDRSVRRSRLRFDDDDPQ
jgi:gas vesicle protein